MDPTRFDALARRLASRRALVLSLGGLLLPAAAAAAPKHKHKKKCKHGTRRCRGQCLAVTICCDDTDCAGGRTCQAGTCACPADKPLVCAGDTICQQCCVHTDCNPSSTGPGNPGHLPYCGVDGMCACSDSLRLCPAHQLCGVCCTDADCAHGLNCITGSTTLVCDCPVACHVAHLCGAACDPQDSDVCQCGGGVTIECAPRQQDGYFCGG